MSDVRPPQAIGAPAEKADDIPTPEDLAELAEYDARLAEVLDECPWCGGIVRAGEPSTRCGGRSLHDACMAEMAAAEGGGA